MSIIVSPSEMKQLDQKTLTEKSITSYDLMVQAGTTMYHSIIENNFIVDHNVVVFAGVGNNGGDALIIAKHLIKEGNKVMVFVVGDTTKISEETSKALQKLPVNYIKNNTDIKELESLDFCFDIVIDGLFGIGLDRDVKGVYEKVINYINTLNKFVISIDIPSGINALNGLVMNKAVKADVTYVVQNLKYGNIIQEAADYNGDLIVLDVGITSTQDGVKSILDKEYSIPKRKRYSHKYHYGNVLIIGGENGMMGAPLMSAYAAYRSGSGLVHVKYRHKVIDLISNPYPEIMVGTYQTIDELKDSYNKKSAIACGPGLGKESNSSNIILSLLQTNKPLLFDADGLYYLKEHLSDISKRGNIIVTPHMKECSILFDTPIEIIRKDPVNFVINKAKEFNLTIVLKDVATIITNGTDTYLSEEATPALASAGTGDVLTGIITSFLGRDYSTLDAALYGVFIHSKASQLAESYYNEDSLMATDLIEEIPTIIDKLKK